MVDKNDKHEENVAGKFYIDKSCIICGLCASLAPNNMRESSDGLQDIVYKQPVNEEELAQCREALSRCPTVSIGDDGDG